MTILHKRKDAAGYTWLNGDLEEGQLGLNIYDGTIHIKQSVAGGGPNILEFQNSNLTVSQLSDLSDVNTSTPTNRNALIGDGTDWESRAIVEADISETSKLW